MVMDMGTIYVCSNNKSVLAFGKPHCQLMSNLIGFLRCDFTRLKGLTNLICNHITLLLSASNVLILPFGQKKFFIGSLTLVPPPSHRQAWQVGHAQAVSL